MIVIPDDEKSGKINASVYAGLRHFGEGEKVGYGPILCHPEVDFQIILKSYP